MVCQVQPMAAAAELFHYSAKSHCLELAPQRGALHEQKTGVPQWDYPLTCLVQPKSWSGPGTPTLLCFSPHLPTGKFSTLSSLWFSHCTSSWSWPPFTLPTHSLLPVTIQPTHPFNLIIHLYLNQWLTTALH